MERCVRTFWREPELVKGCPDSQQIFKTENHRPSKKEDLQHSILQNIL